MLWVGRLTSPPPAGRCFELRRAPSWPPLAASLASSSAWLMRAASNRGSSVGTARTSRASSWRQAGCPRTTGWIRHAPSRRLRSPLAGTATCFSTPSRTAPGPRAGGRTRGSVASHEHEVLGRTPDVRLTDVGPLRARRDLPVQTDLDAHSSVRLRTGATVRSAPRAMARTGRDAKLYVEPPRATDDHRREFFDGATRPTGCFCHTELGKRRRLCLLPPLSAKLSWSSRSPANPPVFYTGRRAPPRKSSNR